MEEDLKPARPMTGAEHYRTANMHRMCALAAVADREKLGQRVSDQQFDRHMRLAELHTQLAGQRLAAVAALQTMSSGGMAISARTGMQHELNQWGMEFSKSEARP